jgi:serine/threonine-protein kinase
MADVFAVQDEITQAITAALMPKLAAERPPAFVKPYTGSLEAYELCLRARYHYQKRTPEGFQIALRLFEQAAARDPDCPPVHAGLAHIYLLMSYFGGVPASVGLPRSKAGALRAVELDDRLALAHVRLADALTFWDWDWAGAEREYLRALELDPDNPEALCRYGLFLWGRLRNAEALVQLRKALEIDPFSLDTNWILGWACISAGQLDEAAELARKMIAMDPNLWTGYHIRGSVHAANGLWAEAVQDGERVAAIEGGVTVAALCSDYARVGRTAEARQALERLERLATRRYIPPAWLAVAYDSVGAEAQARGCLDRAFEEHDLLLVHLKGFMTWATPWLARYRGLLDERGL